VAVSCTPQQLISEEQNSIHFFAVAKYPACSPTQTNEETRQVARFSELSLIKAIYVLIVLLEYKNWKGEEKTVNCTVCFMEWKTAADHYCSEVHLAINVSGLDGEHHSHADESRFPRRSFH